MRRIVAPAAIALVLGVVAAAFVALGPPSVQRAKSLDSIRLNDLIAEAALIHDEYGGDRHPLPAMLSLSRRDPVTGKPYEYRRLDERRYLLCADFALPTSDRDDWLIRDDLRWNHPGGRYCYHLNAGRRYYALPR